MTKKKKTRNIEIYEARVIGENDGILDTEVFEVNKEVYNPEGKKTGKVQFHYDKSKRAHEDESSKGTIVDGRY